LEYIWNVVVANGQYHGGGMWVAPHAAVDDGLFHVTIIGDFSLAEVFWNLPKLYNGKLLQLKKVKNTRGQEGRGLLRSTGPFGCRRRATWPIACCH